MPAKTEKKNDSKPVKKNEKKVQKEVNKVPEKVPDVVEDVVDTVVDDDDDDEVVVKKAVRKTKKVKVEKTGPKKNKSSYMFFCVDERENIKKEKSELNNKEIVVELGARWKQLKETDQDRLKYYEKLAAEDKERYAHEKQLVSSSDVSVQEDSKEKPKTKKTKKQADDSDEQKPDEQKKTKVNGYINFCKENREKVKKDNPTILPKEITKELSVLWKNLSDSEKEEYKNK